MRRMKIIYLSLLLLGTIGRGAGADFSAEKWFEGVYGKQDAGEVFVLFGIEGSIVGISLSQKRFKFLFYSLSEVIYERILYTKDGITSDLTEDLEYLEFEYSDNQNTYKKLLGAWTTPVRGVSTLIYVIQFSNNKNSAIEVSCDLDDKGGIRSSSWKYVPRKAITVEGLE